jgi:predicted Fe-S protein YdhL (DUF1289 family)
VSDPQPAPAWPVLELLACPVCSEPLGPEGDTALACQGCGRRWRERGGWLDFVTDAEAPLDDHWARRQQSMEAWYENLITASDQAEECYRHDYEPLAPLLHDLRGLVLDVGGGNGIARQYLAPDVRYIDLDPSLEWLSPDWLEVASPFPRCHRRSRSCAVSVSGFPSARAAWTPCSRFSASITPASRPAWCARRSVCYAREDGS